jgi:hypothetical protein
MILLFGKSMITMCLRELLRRIRFLGQLCELHEPRSIASVMHRGQPPQRLWQLLSLLDALTVGRTGTPGSHCNIRVVPSLDVISHFFVAKVYQLLLECLHVHRWLRPPFLLGDWNISTGLSKAFNSFNGLICSPVALGFQHMRVS